MKRLHYGWFVCLGCALLIFCTSGLSVNAFTVYQPYILRENGFTNTQSSTILSIRGLFSFAAMLFTGLYYRRLSFRTGMAAAGSLIALGFLLFGLARGILAYYAAAAVIGLGYGFGTMIPISIVLEHWFLKKRTLAIGLCSAATGLSTLGIPSLLTWAILRFGLRAAFLGEAGVCALLILLSFLLIRSSPSDVGKKPYGAGEASEERRRAVRRVSLLHRSDWAFLYVMLLLLGAVTSVAYSHLTVLLNSQGFPPHTIALAITVSGITLTLGKLAFGWLSDRFSIYRRNYVFGALQAAGLLLLCFTGGHPGLLFAAICAYSAGLALTTVGLSEWAGDLSTAAQYDDTVRRFHLGYAAGSFVFSSLPSVLADQFGGSYVPAYLFFLFCIVFVVLTVQWFYRHRVLSAA